MSIDLDQKVFQFLEEERSEGRVATNNVLEEERSEGRVVTNSVLEEERSEGRVATNNMLEEERSEGRVATNNMLRTKAVQIVVSLSIQGFKGSNSWLWRLEETFMG